MKRSVFLNAIGSGETLQFELDDETLGVSGSGAGAVLAMMHAAAELGSVLIDPYPTSVEITDPLRDRGQFAAVLAEGYALPEWLREWLPAADESDDDSEGEAVDGVLY